MYARVETEALDDLADAELIRRFKRGDDEALEVLLGRHADALYRFCCHLVPNREDAEDICQESLARAIDRVDSLQRGAAFRSWLFRIARNLSVDSFRSQRRVCPLPDEELTPVLLDGNDPHDRIAAGEEHETVTRALGRLTESHKHVLLLREVEGLSYSDIAHRLNVSQSAVETLLFRARRRLREEYRKSEGRLGGLAVASLLRSLGLRLAPLGGGPPVAAKVALTAVVVGGATLSARNVIPVLRATMVRHAAPVPSMMNHHNASAAWHSVYRTHHTSVASPAVRHVPKLQLPRHDVAPTRSAHSRTASAVSLQPVWTAVHVHAAPPAAAPSRAAARSAVRHTFSAAPPTPRQGVPVVTDSRASVDTQPAGSAGVSHSNGSVAPRSTGSDPVSSGVTQSPDQLVPAVQHNDSAQHASPPPAAAQAASSPAPAPSTNTAPASSNTASASAASAQAPAAQNGNPSTGNGQDPHGRQGTTPGDSGQSGHQSAPPGVARGQQGGTSPGQGKGEPQSGRNDGGSDPGQGSGRASTPGEPQAKTPPGHARQGTGSVPVPAASSVTSSPSVPTVPSLPQGTVSPRGGGRHP